MTQGDRCVFIASEFVSHTQRKENELALFVSLQKDVKAPGQVNGGVSDSGKN